MTKKTRTIVQKVIVPADPDEVYEAFMDPEKHSDFTHTKTTGSQEVDGEVSASDGYITARNIALEKGKKILQEWTTSEWPDGYGPSVLEIDLKRVKGGDRTDHDPLEGAGRTGRRLRRGMDGVLLESSGGVFPEGKGKERLRHAGPDHLLGMKSLPAWKASATAGPIDR
jgi:uncharacterized protein YndB with AHSA1/START domain